MQWFLEELNIMLALACKRDRFNNHVQKPAIFNIAILYFQRLYMIFLKAYPVEDTDGILYQISFPPIFG